MLKYDSVGELVEKAVDKGKNISDIVLEDQAAETGRTEEDLLIQMDDYLKVMEDAIKSDMQVDMRSPSGLSGGDAYKLKQAVDAGQTLGGNILGKALVKAIAMSEVNACMGRIVAAPTAGSCGIIPSTLLTIMEERKIPRQKVIMSLFTASGIGMVIAKRASVSGAEGGCQAECGSASAMAAAALVEMAGGNPGMSANACAIALKNILGLVCDPVAGLVEVPCIKRNAMGAANALAAADMALAGIESVIPVDEVIDAMRSVGNLMPSALKETAEGGLAATPTARRLARAIFNRK